MLTIKKALPDVAIFLSLVVSTIIIDAILHFTDNAVWGRYIGYIGTLLLVSSFAYSARKRKWVTRGRPVQFLRLHEILAWVGSVMIMVHGGIHLNPTLPWLAMASMIIAVASGLTGKFLLRKSRDIVEAKKKELIGQGINPDQIEDQLYWDALVVDLMKKWRTVHLPITVIFTFLALLHVITTFIFWRW
jgi:hypothetical protein